MKKRLLTLSFTIVLALTGCASNSLEDNITTEEQLVETFNEDTLSGRLANSFLSQIATSNDIEKIANELASSSGYDCVVVSITPGYLNGFSKEITGFSSGVMFSPMIGSIPLVAYIFEVNDALEFKKYLEENADPAWNICTQAAETLCTTYNNYVFFTMCPGDEF